ncbi:MAG: IclR family transcriptional regulator [Conexibacter sp.]
MTAAAEDGAKPTRIQSVARACQLLMWIAQEPHGATAKEVAFGHRLALPTTYHLLNTLVDAGLLRKNAERRYVLGRSTSILAQAYLRGRSVPASLLSGLRELARRTGETTYLADWGEHEIRVLASVEGSNILRVAEVAGGPYAEGHARASGKVLLAYAWPELRATYLRAHPLRRLTPSTIVDGAAFERELAEIRERGVAFDREEFAEGVSCVAAPLLEQGRIVAAYGVSMPTERFRRSRDEIVATLLDVIAGIDPDASDADAVATALARASR